MNAERDPWHDGMQAGDRLARWSRDGGDALAALSDIGQLRRLLDESELQAVRVARQQGKSWAEIAIKLGVTRQSAWERWRDLDAEAEPYPEAGPAGALSRASRSARRKAWITVPLVVGTSVEYARAHLAESGLVAVSADADGPSVMTLAARGFVVTDQVPEAGAKAQSGAPVKLWSRGNGGGAGVREPRRPMPTPQVGRKVMDEPGTGRGRAMEADRAGDLGSDFDRMLRHGA